MVDTLIVKCPKCGQANEAAATNCANCRINLEWALESWEREQARQPWQGPAMIDSFTREAEEAWGELAALTGLSYRRKCVTGIYRGRSLALEFEPATNYSNSIGDAHAYSPSLTHISLSVNNQAHISLKVRPKGLLDSFGFWGKGIQTGDERFDGRFLIRGRPQVLVTRALGSADLRQRLAGLLGVDVLVKLDRQGLRYQTKGLELDLDRVNALFDVLCDLAEEIEKAPA